MIRYITHACMTYCLVISLEVMRWNQGIAGYDVMVHVMLLQGILGYDVSIVGYGMVYFNGMVCQYGMMLVCYVMVCYCMLLWYDVSIIGYCRVWYGILVWYGMMLVSQAIVGYGKVFQYCRVWYGILVWYDVSIIRYCRV